MFANKRANLTDNPAVSALQCGGGAGDGTVGTVLVASLAGHGRGEGGAGAACWWGGSAAGQSGAGADPLVVTLRTTHTHTFVNSSAKTTPCVQLGINGKQSDASTFNI